MWPITYMYTQHPDHLESILALCGTNHIDVESVLSEVFAKRKKLCV